MKSAASNKKIGIIGGGYTGLALAYFLTKEKGYNVTIFERGANFGGLASGFKIHGNNLERAYHHLFRTDRDILDLVKELGIENKLIWLESSISLYFEGKLYSFSGPIDLLKFSPLPFFDRLRTGIIMFFLQRTRYWRQFIDVSALSWMKKYCGENAARVIWEPLLRGKFHKFYKKISMAWLWARIFTRANSRSLLAKEKLGYFKGGFDVVTQALLKNLKKKKVTLKLGSTVEYIKKKGEKIEVKENGQTHIFDKVVATVPSKAFAMLVKDNSKEMQSYVKKLDSIDYIGAITLIFSSEQDLSKYYWHNINDTKKPFLVFINHTKFTGKKLYQGKNVYYLGTYIPHEHEYFEMDEKEIQKIWFTSLKEIFPDFDQKQIIEKHLFKFKFAQHIVDTKYEQKIPEYKTPMEGLYLSNFSQIYPEDRGTNFSIREARKLEKILKED